MTALATQESFDVGTSFLRSRPLALLRSSESSPMVEFRSAVAKARNYLTRKLRGADPSDVPAIFDILLEDSKYAVLAAAVRRTMPFELEDVVTRWDDSDAFPRAPASLRSRMRLIDKLLYQVLRHQMMLAVMMMPPAGAEARQPVAIRIDAKDVGFVGHRAVPAIVQSAALAGQRVDAELLALSTFDQKTPLPESIAASIVQVAIRDLRSFLALLELELRRRGHPDTSVPIEVLPARDRLDLADIQRQHLRFLEASRKLRGKARPAT